MNDVSLYANCEEETQRRVRRTGLEERGEGEGATHLLAETNAGPAVEGEEDERVRDEVLLHTLVDELVGIAPSGPQGSSQQRMRRTELRHWVIRVLGGMSKSGWPAAVFFHHEPVCPVPGAPSSHARCLSYPAT